MKIHETRSVAVTAEEKKRRECKFPTQGSALESNRSMACVILLHLKFLMERGLVDPSCEKLMKHTVECAEAIRDIAEANR